MASMQHIEAALIAWRAAARRIEAADGRVTAEMERELAEAKSRYQEIVAANMNGGHAAAGEEPSLSDDVWSEVDQVERRPGRLSEA